MLTQVMLALSISAAPGSAAVDVGIAPEAHEVSALDASLAEAGSFEVPGQKPMTRQEVVADRGHLIREVIQEDSAPHGVVVSAGMSEDEVEFFDKFFAFGTDDDLHPEIEDNKVGIWLLWVFFGLYGGPLWIHKVMLDDPTIVNDDYNDDALTFWLWHLALFAGNFAFMYVGIVCFIVGVYVTMLVGGITMLIRSVWLNPVSYINFLNRHAVGGGGGKKRRKSRRKAMATVRDLVPTAAQLAY